MVHLLISKIMDTLKNIQGVIFDYGGTIDTKQLSLGGGVVG